MNLVLTLAKSGKSCIEQIKEMGCADILLGVVEMHPDNEMIKGFAAGCFRLITGEEAIKSAIDLVSK